MQIFENQRIRLLSLAQKSGQTRCKANAIKLRKSKIVTGIRNDPVTIFMNKM